MNTPITFIELQNWVSYKKARFDFHPNVNIIIGPSGKGKSAMMAAFFKLFCNRPMGEEFVSWWGGETKLSTGTDTWSLGYHKTSKKAFYNLVIDDTPTQFTAFGTTVPSEITNLLSISETLNIQKQFTKKAPIFLLSETPGDAAKKLNTYANLTGIDETIQAGHSDIKESKRDIKEIEKQIQEKETELTAYFGLDELDILITQAETKEKYIKDCDDQIHAIENRLSSIQELRECRRSLKDWDTIQLLTKKTMEASETVKALDSDLNKLVERQESIQGLKSELALLSRICGIIPWLDKYEIQREKIVQYTGKIKDIERSQAIIKASRNSLKTTSKLYTKFKTELKTIFPKICPLCKGPVDKALL